MMNNNFLARRIRKFFEHYNILDKDSDPDNFEICVVNTLDNNDKDGINIMIDYFKDIMPHQEEAKIIYEELWGRKNVK